MQPKRPNLQPKHPSDDCFQLTVTITRAEVNSTPHSWKQDTSDTFQQLVDYKNIYLFYLWRGNHSWLNRINCASPTKLSKTFSSVDSAPGSSWSFVTFIVKCTFWNIRRRLLVVWMTFFSLWRPDVACSALTLTSNLHLHHIYTVIMFLSCANAH